MPPSRLSTSCIARSLGRCLAESVASAAPCRASRSASSFRVAASTSSRPSPSLRPRRHAPLHIHAAASMHTTAIARFPEVAAAASPAAVMGADGHLHLPADYVPPTQPPSAKQPDIRKTQLLRTYTSLLRSTPLILVFQHSNLTGPEWTVVRRELNRALELTAASEKQKGIAWPEDFASNIRMQVIRTRMFDVALRVTEFYDPATAPPDVSPNGKTYTHDLSKAAYTAVKKAMADGSTSAESSVYAQLSPLLVGPLALLTFPAVSPAHLAAALSVLTPNPPAYPPPARKKNPGYYEPMVQNALQKLLLVGGRIEGKVFDTDGVRWVGSISGGKAGLQAQLVALLQSAGLGLTSALEGASKSLWLTMESRKSMLEEDSKQS